MTDELKFISASMTDGLMILDKDLNIRYFSEPASSLVGINSNKAQKLNCLDIFKELSTLLPKIPYKKGTDEFLAAFAEELDSLEISISLIAGIKRFFRFSASLFGDGLEKRVTAVFTNLSKSKEFDELRKDFMDSMSHELRTPISTIKTYVATLSHPKADFDKKTQLGFLNIVDGEADKLSKIVDSIFEASRISRHRLTLRYEPVNLAEVINEAIAYVSTSYTHNISVTLLTRDLIMGDREQLLHAFIHVLSNAVKFSPDGGKIDVEITEEGQQDSVLVSISDEGVGIPFDLRERIFEPFFKVDIGTTKKIYSVGMGLFIIKKIIEAHNGRLWVESTLGLGSKFFFLLPKKYDLQSSHSSTNDNRL